MESDERRVILRPMLYPGSDRVGRIMRRVELLPDGEAEDMLRSILDKFSGRHKDFETQLKKHFDRVGGSMSGTKKMTTARQLLTGALLSNEYSYQSAALFNPSMVPHPDQSGLKRGEKRFMMSLRATGEGHISSIVFQTGIAGKEGTITLEPLTPYSVTGEYKPVNGQEMEYDLVFDADSLPEERVIFPGTEVESHGMEDLRLVEFREGGNNTYFGTYTAWNGKMIQSRLLETEDFRSFRIRSLTGPSASDKGMGLFPEKIKGRYAIISRQGGENISIMFSNDLYRWEHHELLMEPLYPFELAQLGNCGSPLRTEEGWLLLTHGVGPVREYTISAVLLDPDDPRKIIARLDRPLIRAEDHEREGYVPNVVYSCGAMIHADKLFIPYAMSDSRCGFAWAGIDELLSELKK